MRCVQIALHGQLVVMVFDTPTATMNAVAGAVVRAQQSGQPPGVEWGPPTVYSQTGISDLAALGPEQFVVVVGTAVMVGSVDVGTMRVSLSTAFHFVNGSSLDARVTVLGLTLFALSYYNSSAGAIELYTRVATVSGAGASAMITFGAPVKYADNHNVHAIQAMSPTHYLLAFPMDNPASVNHSGGPLTALLAMVDPVSLNVSVGPSAVLPSSRLLYYFDVARVDSSTAVAVFVDGALNNGIRAVSIEVSNPETVPVFGSTVVVNSGDGGGMMRNIYSYIHTEQLRLRELLVVYSDLSNGGRATVRLIGLSDAADLTLLGPDLPVSAHAVDATQYRWLAAAVVMNDSLIVLDAVVTPGSEGATDIHAAYGFYYPAPLGIALSASAAQIALQGTVPSPTELAVGQYYYADSTGALLVAGPAAQADAGRNQYALLNGGRTIAALDALVGIAADRHRLVLVRRA